MRSISGDSDAGDEGDGNAELTFGFGLEFETMIRPI